MSTMSGSFSIKAGEYEGPLDLLLNLVEDRKMLVSDVSLTDVADSFLQYISTHGAFPVAEAAHFVVVASTLLLLKSRSLLPVLTLSDEEEGGIVDLELRLKLLQIIRVAARALSAGSSRMFFGDGVRVTDPLFVPPPDLSQLSLLAAAKSALAQAPKPVDRDEVAVKSVVSLDEMIERLTDRVQRAITMTFRDFSAHAVDPREVVVGFLAMLEIVKRGFATVTQDTQFAEITIEYAGNTNTPRYD
jgi:segregation and condensation protein A